ncbi:hypothetical protein SEVIR_1G313001v4 [Setaria viridis]
MFWSRFMETVSNRRNLCRQAVPNRRVACRKGYRISELTGGSIVGNHWAWAELSACLPEGPPNHCAFRSFPSYPLMKLCQNSRTWNPIGSRLDGSPVQSFLLPVLTLIRDVYSRLGSWSMAHDEQEPHNDDASGGEQVRTDNSRDAASSAIRARTVQPAGSCNR